MSKEIEEFLDKLVPEICHSFQGGGDIGVVCTLRERLQPLLEAGQAMRKSRVNISDDAMAWDAALAAGKGQA